MFLLIISFVVVLFAIIRLLVALISGMRMSSDITYNLCRPFFFGMKMLWGFVGWIFLFCMAGVAIEYIINYF